MGYPKRLVPASRIAREFKIKVRSSSLRDLLSLLLTIRLVVQSPAFDESLSLTFGQLPSHYQEKPIP